jgi:hypothetical protein
VSAAAAEARSDLDAARAPARARPRQFPAYGVGGGLLKRVPRPIREYCRVRPGRRRKWPRLRANYRQRSLRRRFYGSAGVVMPRGRGRPRARDVRLAHGVSGGGDVRLLMVAVKGGIGSDRFGHRVGGWIDGNAHREGHQGNAVAATAIDCFC